MNPDFWGGLNPTYDVPDLPRRNARGQFVRRWHAPLVDISPERGAADRKDVRDQAGLPDIPDTGHVLN